MISACFVAYSLLSRGRNITPRPDFELLHPSLQGTRELFVTGDRRAGLWCRDDYGQARRGLCYYVMQLRAPLRYGRVAEAPCRVRHHNYLPRGVAQLEYLADLR